MTNFAQKNDDDVAVNQITSIMTYIQIPLIVFQKIYEFINTKYLKNEKAINANEQKEIEQIILVIYHQW